MTDVFRQAKNYESIIGRNNILLSKQIHERALRFFYSTQQKQFCTIHFSNTNFT